MFEWRTVWNVGPFAFYKGDRSGWSLMAKVGRAFLRFGIEPTLTPIADATSIRPTTFP